MVVGGKTLQLGLRLGPGRRSDIIGMRRPNVLLRAGILDACGATSNQPPSSEARTIDSRLFHRHDRLEGVMDAVVAAAVTRPVFTASSNAWWSRSFWSA